MINIKRVFFPIFLSCSVLLCGCTSDGKTFPSIPEETTYASAFSEPAESETSVSSVEELTVALPYSDDTIKCLSEMFYAKNNGTWNSAETGATVAVSYLDSINTNYVVNNIGVSDEGASLDNYNTWTADGAVPDVFLASDSKAFYDKNLTMELNDELAVSDYIDSSATEPSCLEFNSVSGVYYGIPHYSSAIILMGNNDFIPESGSLPAQYTLSDLYDYLGAIDSRYEDAVPFASAYELTPYIGSCFDTSSPSFMTYDEECRSSDYVKSLYDAGYSSTDSTAASDASNPVYTRNAALWLETSAHIGTWSEYYPSKLYLMRLPAAENTDSVSLYLQNYALCIAKDTDNPDFAAKFAEFISFDPDAVQLIYRLEDMTGFLPVIKDEDVWDIVNDNDSFGALSSGIEHLMNEAVYCPGSYDNSIYRSVNNYLSGYYGTDSDFDWEACLGN